MATSKDNRGFFRRVAKFVTNPATQWGEVEEDAPPPEVSRQSEAAKSELKEMIERKRRNDFVRKRELDLLRKLRRDGLSSEQLATLGQAADIADSDILVEPPVKADAHVKTKIDEIEQQISAESQLGSKRAAIVADAEVPTEPMKLNTRPGAARIDTQVGVPRTVIEPRPRAKPAADTAARSVLRTPFMPRTPPDAAAAPGAPAYGPLRTPFVPRVAAAAASRLGSLGRWSGFGQSLGLEVNEARPDPELDAAVIAFANADPAFCEQSLEALIGPGGSRCDQPATWRVLLDFYRAVGQQSGFEALAADFSARFGVAAPRWLSIPQALGEAQRGGGVARVHWHVPASLDASTLAQLPARAERWSLPWVIDWRELQRIEPDAQPALSALFRRWSDRRIDMRWLGGEHLLKLLEAASPPGDATADRSCWQARLDAMRMLHKPAGFDDVAVDYASTFQTATPAWERAVCRVRFVDDLTPNPKTDTTLGEMTTAFVETTLVEDADHGAVAQVELAGELVGDISLLMARIDQQIGVATKISISCHLLVRVDFLASGDLLNWVIAKHGENRQLSFVSAHRLVAMFFGAMGIDEYASIVVDEA